MIYPFIIFKNLSKLRLKQNFKFIKATFRKRTTTIIIPKRKMLKAFPSEIGNRVRRPTITILFDTVLKAQASTTKKKI